MATNDKLKSALIDQFKKDFPDSPLESMDSSDLAEVPGWISTGNYALNWAVSKDIFRGLPLGRAVLFSGDAGSGKSLIALNSMKDPNLDLIIYLDSEGGGATKEFAEFLGVIPAKVLYSTVNTTEELIAKMKSLIDNIEKNKATKSVLLIIDSVSMISTERELNDSDKADMGNKTKQVRTFFRQYTRKMQRLNICVVMTAHLITNIGGYGPTKIVTGGTILQYMPSAELRFTRVNADTTLEQSAIGASSIKTRCDIQKSRFGTYGKRVTFDLDMAHGLDPYVGLFDIMRDYGVIITAGSDIEAQIKEKKIFKKSTGWWMFKAWDDPRAIEIGKYLAEKELCKSGKFREAKIAEWAEEDPEFLNKIGALLKTLDQDVEEKIVDDDEEVEEA
jgi:RecA/RadA recombinase